MLQIESDIYAWLVSIDILDDTVYDPTLASELQPELKHYPNLPVSVANFEFASNGTIVVNSAIQRIILNGFFFPPLFCKLNHLRNILNGKIYPEEKILLDVINDDQTQIRLKNWDIIIKHLLSEYGLFFNEDDKTLLVACDNEKFQELFRRLYDYYTKLQAEIDKNTESKGLKPNTTKSAELPVFDNDKPGDLPKIRFNEDVIDPAQIIGEGKNTKPLNQTRSVLEFIIIALCKSMGLTPKQSTALLSDNKKYLAHILIKGLAKKNFEPVLDFYNQVLAEMDYFVKLIQINSIAYANQVSKNIELSLSTFKFGLQSKNTEVVAKTGSLLSKLANELIEINLISAAWDWFVNPNGGLEACIICLNKHDDCVNVVVSLLNSFGKFHLYELFTNHLKYFLTSDSSYFTFVTAILPMFSNITTFNDEFIKGNLKQFFMDYINEVSRSPNATEKIKSALLLGEIWIRYSIYIDTSEENYQFLAIFKVLYKDAHHLVQVTALAQMFRILFAFAEQRNTFVGVIYKAIIFTFVEFHEDVAIRDFILSNFTYCFRKILSIPVGIFVEPYIRQISLSIGKTYSFNFNDIRIIEAIAYHPRFNVKEAIYMLDLLGKIYLDVGKDNVTEETALRGNTYRGVYFHKPVNLKFTFILSKYLQHEIGIEFCFEYVKMLIQVFCKLDKNLSEKIYFQILQEQLAKEKEEEYNFRDNNDNNNNVQTKPDPIFFELDVIDNETEKNNTLNFRHLTKRLIVKMVRDILAINNKFINGVIKNLLIVAASKHYNLYHFHSRGLTQMLAHFGDINVIVYYYNQNKFEFDMDGDFEVRMDLIYDKVPNVEAERKEMKTPQIIGSVIDEKKGGSVHEEVLKEDANVNVNEDVMNRTENTLVIGDDGIIMEEKEKKDNARNAEKKRSINNNNNKQKKKIMKLKTNDVNNNNNNKNNSSNISKGSTPSYNNLSRKETPNSRRKSNDYKSTLKNVGQKIVQNVKFKLPIKPET